MRKNIIIIFLFMFEQSMCQTSSEIIKFNSATLYYCKTNESLLKDISTVVLSKNVTIEFNTITKDYVIEFLNSANRIQVFTLKFNNYISGEYKICESSYQNVKFYITDILQLGVLTIFRDQENPDKGHDVYRIEGAVLSSENKINITPIPTIDLNKKITFNQLLFMLSYNKSYGAETDELRLSILRRNLRD